MYQFDIPTLSGEQWERACRSRFIASVVEKFERIVEEQGGRAGVWRALYLRRIHNYEMLSLGATAPNSEAMVSPHIGDFRNLVATLLIEFGRSVSMS